MRPVAGALRPASSRTACSPSSASFQLATMTTGTSTATSAMSTRAMPSAPTAYCTPKASIQSWAWTNWKRSPSGSNAAHMTIAPARTTSEVSSET